MRRIKALLVAAALLLITWGAAAQIALPPGFFGGTHGGGGAYVGPGDAVPGVWSAYYSTTTAFSAAVATAGQPAYDATRTGGTCTATFQASGQLVATPCAGSTSVATFCAGGCRATELRDQTQGGNCAGSCDLSNDGSHAAIVVLNCLSGFHCLTNGGNGLDYSAAAPTFTQPLSIVAITMCVSSCNDGSSYSPLLTNSGAGAGVYPLGTDGNGPGYFSHFGTNFSSADTAPNVWHYVAVTVASGSCSIYIDGTSTTGPCGAGGVTSVMQFLGSIVGSEVTEVLELGIANVALSSGQISTLQSNAISRLGY